MTPELKNIDRAGFAFVALAAFAAQTGQIPDLDADPETVLADLVCDLHHWADTAGVKMGRVLARAAEHYTGDREEETEVQCDSCGGRAVGLPGDACPAVHLPSPTAYKCPGILREATDDDD